MWGVGSFVRYRGDWVANEKNLIPLNKRTKNEQRKICSNGGKKSGQKRREQKTIQDILKKYLAKSVNSNETFKELAEKTGITGKQSVKELITAVCVINTLEKGDVDKLSKICELLGEQTQYDDNNADVEETLAVIKECAYADRDKQ